MNVSIQALVAVAALSAAGIASTSAGTITPLAHTVPGGIQITFLMTDGTVVGQQGSNPAKWWKLTPDATGSYVNGTWTAIASLPKSYAPTAFSSAVLPDGRLVVVGGEYTTLRQNFSLTNHGAIYDPKANAWTMLTPPAGIANIGDSPAVVLADGRFAFGDKLTTQVAALDAKTLQWSILGSAGKGDIDAEEGWTLLPNGTVLTADVTNAPNAETFSPATQSWTGAGNTIVDLHSPTDVVGCLPYTGPTGGGCYYPPGEIGPAILRPDGTVFATGSYTNANPSSAGHTAIYDSRTGVWSVGPDFPNNDNAGDSFAVLLPNGNVLVEGVHNGTGYEFDGTHLTATTAARGLSGSLLVLPTGQVLVAGSAVYQSTGTYQASWAPTITKLAATTVSPGASYQIWGTQFNGLSAAQSFGDEFQAATNYPLVRITNTATGHVAYARTHDHSTMGVATGSTVVSTTFDVPKTIDTGAATLEVVANGIPSQPVSIVVQ